MKNTLTYNVMLYENDVKKEIMEMKLNQTLRYNGSFEEIDTRTLQTIRKTLKVVPTVISTTGAVPKCLYESIKQLELASSSF